MKKTTKKLSINKETVVSFEVLSSQEEIKINGGTGGDACGMPRPTNSITCETQCECAEIF